MKINIGSGFKRIEGFLNIDSDPGVSPDYVINLDDPKVKLPFDDSSVSEIKAHHILEHIGSGFIPLMIELWRVSEHGCLLDILVPHHFHDNFYGDPTHKRPITVSGMDLFSKKSNIKHIADNNSYNGLALKFGIDFDLEHYEFEPDPFYKPLIDRIEALRKAGTLKDDDAFTFQRLMREGNNVALNTIIKMRAVK